MTDPNPRVDGESSARLKLSMAEEPAATAPITGLSHVQLHVSDVEVSARWYSTVLSMVPYAEDLAIGYVALRQRGAKIVMVLTERREDRSESTEPVGDTLDHIAFAVSDGASLQAWAVHLSDSGIEHDDIVLENGHPSLQLRDPDGIAIELVAP
jgi:glyoxylase I family protein